MDADYVCSLNPDDLARARSELNEDPRNRLGAVRKLREWIDEQPHIKFPTDTKILLMYLRHAKFSQLKARDVIEKNCVLKTEDVDLFNNYDPLDATIQRFLRTGIFSKLPGRGDKGQALILIRMGIFDPEEWKNQSKVFVMTLFMLLHYVLMDEAVQVCGVEYFVDLTGFTFAHQIFYKATGMYTIAKHLSNTLPLRWIMARHYNAAPLYEVTASFLKTFLSRKIRGRFKLHGSNMVKMYQYYPKEQLPIEYLPDDYTGPNAGTTQSLIDKTIEELQSPEVRAYLAHLTSDDWKIDQAKKPKTKISAASFRKLSVF